MTEQLSWNTASAAATKEIFTSAEGHKFKLHEMLDLFNIFVDTWGSSEAPIPYDSEMLSKESLWRSLGAMAIGWGKDNGRLMFEEHVAATLVKKQYDYGHNNIARFGFIGLLIRVHDKIARLENLISKESENVLDSDLINIVIDCIDYIYDKDNIFYAKGVQKEELVEFVDNLSRKELEQIRNFFDNMPKIKHTIDFKCNKCGHEEIIDIEGTASFFG